MKTVTKCKLVAKEGVLALNHACWYQSLTEGDSAKDGNMEATEHSTSLPSFSTKLIFLGRPPGRTVG